MAVMSTPASRIRWAVAGLLGGQRGGPPPAPALGLVRGAGLRQPLAEEVALVRRDGGEHRRLQSARRGREVDALTDRPEGDATPLQLPDGCEHVRERPAEAVQAHNSHRVTLKGVRKEASRPGRLMRAPEMVSS